MASAEQARKLLALHGMLQTQPSSDWKGDFLLPDIVKRFYQEVGPNDVHVKGYGNDYFFPKLASLWEFQAGYRWNGLTNELIPDWNDHWLVVADEGGDPFILSRSSGVILHAYHGEGVWDAQEMFPDLNTLAACLGQLGAVTIAAGDSFLGKAFSIRPEHRQHALHELTGLLGTESKAEEVLGRLGWG
jgi:hypothetical protein